MVISLMYKCHTSHDTVKYTLKANVYLLLFSWDDSYIICTHSMQFLIPQIFKLTLRPNGHYFLLIDQHFLN
jgi:hypothetical protein